MTTTPAAIRFHPGRTYYGRSICDHEAITTMLVLRRTRHTITVVIGAPVDRDGPRTLRPQVRDGIEYVRPNGNYSMALTIGADREQPTEPQAFRGTVFNSAGRRVTVVVPVKEPRS